jgi:hypothetical protein
MLVAGKRELIIFIIISFIAELEPFATTLAVNRKCCNGKAKNGKEETPHNLGQLGATTGVFLFAM